MADREFCVAAGHKYMTVSIDVVCVLQSWKKSLFAHVWLNPDGSLRALDSLPDDEKVQREHVEMQISRNIPIQRPLLGIGLFDNVEIGMGKAEFLTLAALGAQQLTVHIMKSDESDFQTLVRAVGSDT